jgi:hypothetical protein
MISKEIELERPSCLAFQFGACEISSAATRTKGSWFPNLYRNKKSKPGRMNGRRTTGHCWRPFI